MKTGVWSYRLVVNSKLKLIAQELKLLSKILNADHSFVLDRIIRELNKLIEANEK
jgi:hypothetical protein